MHTWKGKPMVGDGTPLLRERAKALEDRSLSFPFSNHLTEWLCRRLQPVVPRFESGSGFKF